jgi:hypothetical protein
MADLTRSGAPVGAGNSKLRRKQLEIMSLDLGMEQRRIEILEKEEELERMAAQQLKLRDELTILEQQIATARKGEGE